MPHTSRMTTTDLTTQTPVEIDTQIAALYQERYLQQDRANQQWGSLVFYVTEVQRNLGLHKGFGKVSAQVVRDFLSEHSEISESEEMQAEAYTQPWIKSNAQKAWGAYLKYLDHAAKADEALMDTEPLDAEWVRRGRWNRAFLVTNGNGHVHRSMNCSSCYPTTQYYWVTEYSDHTEAEIVEAAGERACTVCYPSAPVGVKGTKMFTPDEREKQQRAQEREQKRQERAAATITLEVWDQRWNAPQAERKQVTWKTTRALQNDAGSLVRVLTGAYALINGFDIDKRSGDITEGLQNLRVMLEALQERGIDTDALVAKNHKRAVKEGGRGWDGVL